MNYLGDWCSLSPPRLFKFYLALAFNTDFPFMPLHGESVLQVRVHVILIVE